MKLKSDSSLLEIFRSKSSVKIGLLLLLGLSLILLGSLSGEKNKESATVGEEERAAELCSFIEGVGECRVMMTYREDSGESRVYAVAVLCDGAESAEVRSDIVELICSLYGIGAHRVKVLQLNE